MIQRPLRVLYIPEMYSSRKLTGISMVNNVLDMVRRTVGRVYWYFVVPPEDSDFELISEKLPNLEFLHFGPKKFKASLAEPPTNELIEYLCSGGFLFDVVVTQKYAYSLQIKNMLFRKDMMWLCATDMPVVNFLTETGNDPDMLNLQQDSTILSILGGLAGGHTIVLTDIDKKWLLGHARKWFSPWQVSQMLDRVHVVRPCVDWSLVDARRKQYDLERAVRLKTGEIHLFYGGVFEARKHVPQVADAMLALRKRGLPVKFIVKTMAEEGRVAKKGWVNYEGVEIEFRVDRQRYLDTLGQGDVLVSASDYYGTGLALMEAVRSGMVGVFLDRPWIRERVPDDYPFMAGSMESMEKKLWAIARDIQWARSEGRKLEERWGELFSADVAADNMYRVLNGVVSESAAADSKKVRRFYAFDPIQKFCALAGESFTMDELAEGAKRFSRSSSFNVLSLGTRYIRKAVAQCGFVDDCRTSTVRFVRLDCL